MRIGLNMPGKGCAALLLFFFFFLIVWNEAALKEVQANEKGKRIMLKGKGKGAGFKS